MINLIGASTIDFTWYYELPLIFQFVIIAICIMIILMALISGIYYLPKKNREMNQELLSLDQEIVKKKASISAQDKAYVEAQERHNKEMDRLSTEKANALKEKEALLNENLSLQEEKIDLLKQIDKLKKGQGGRPKKTTKKTTKKDDKSTSK